MLSRHAADTIELAAERVKRGEMSRRSFMWAMAALGFAPIALNAKGALAKASEIVVVNFGGDAVAAWGTAWGEPFTADTGIKVTIIGGEPTPGSIKAMVESGSVTWDCTDAMPITCRSSPRKSSSSPTITRS